jgi:toxin ParE1/3/4
MPLRILHEAELELWETVEFYEDKAKGLGLDFLSEIEQALSVIADAPWRWRLREDGTRRFLTGRFPYVVVYTLVGDQITVLSFSHSKRRPGHWLTHRP